MSSILKVDTLQDSGGNNLVTSNGSGVITSSAFGKVLQVVSTTKTDTFSTTAGGDAPATITGLTATITPSSTSSKILVMPNINVGSDGDNHIAITIFRGTTAICIGDTAGNRPRASFTASLDSTGHTWLTQSASQNFLDSPSTTSATTYSLKIGGNGGTAIYINKSSRDNNATNEDGRYASTITLMEISA
jgi:hypothetical protein